MHIQFVYAVGLQSCRFANKSIFAGGRGSEQGTFLNGTTIHQSASQVMPPRLLNRIIEQNQKGLREPKPEIDFESMERKRNRVTGGLSQIVVTIEEYAEP
jgi:hypothetical protein